MKIQYLGTAAAEGWPALFCKCEACEKARISGGRDIRTRSQSIVDDKLLIDMPADTYYHALKYSLDFSEIKDVLITHSHEDHFYPLDIILKAPPYAHGGSSNNIRVYGNDVIVKLLRDAMNISGIPNIGDYIVPVEVEPFKAFNAGDYTVTALLADHINGENCYIYIIEKKGKRLLYAHDTGIFPKKSWDYLKNIMFDAVSLDCTFGLDYNETGHMGFPNTVDVSKRLMVSGCADINTKFIINHFSHNGKKMHSELSSYAETYGFLTAFDGMSVTF
jgi:phosphoribosyl 1,2-cyclic phosphate phosphodiesterase